MNIQKLKKKYPYKETKAEIIKIILCHSKEGYVTVYGKEQAIDDLRFENTVENFSLREYNEYEIYNKISEYARITCGVVDEDVFGNLVSKVYEHWYEYRLLVEYKDLDEQKHQGTIEMVTEKHLSCGEKINVCYLIDQPDKVVRKSYRIRTVEDYKENLRFRCFIAAAMIFIVMIFLILYKGLV